MKPNTRKQLSRVSFHAFKVQTQICLVELDHIVVIVMLLSLFTETGGLFMLGIRLLQLFSDYQSDLKKIVSLMGLYFQVRDDYANLMLAEVRANVIAEPD